MNRTDLLNAMVQRTGLTKNTVKELLKSGWVYKEELNGPSRFEKYQKENDRYVS